MSSNQLGSRPAFIKWEVVRGDTATLKVEFYEENQKNFYNTENWSYSCTAYDQRKEEFYNLQVEEDDGFVVITALPSITSLWGDGINNLVAKLDFDLEVIMDDGIIWTPIIGVISVIGDVTGRDD
jgi:hypothetical protein